MLIKHRQNLEQQITLPWRLKERNKFLEDFCLAYNPKHWSNENETLRLIDEVLVPYIAKVKEKKSLPPTQRSLLLWDAFKAQSTEVVKDSLKTNRIKLVRVPKNMTHLLQPLDLTTNATFKNFEKRAFSEYFTSCIMKALQVDFRWTLQTEM